MSPLIRFFIITLFLVGIVAVGILGTSTTMTFVWPGYLCLAIAGVASVMSILRRTKFAIPAWGISGALLLVGYLLIRASNSPVAYFAREDIALLVTCFITYVVFLSIMDASKWRSGLFFSIVFLLALNVGIAMLQAFKVSDWSILPGYARSISDRVGGVFNHPEHFAGFMALGVPLLLAATVFGLHSKKTKVALCTLAFLCFISICLAESLLGFLAMLIGLLVLVVSICVLCWKNLKRQSQKSIVWGFSLTALLVAAFLSFNVGRIESLVENKIMSRGHASIGDAWTSSLEQFGENPLIGTGSRTFYYFGRKFHPPHSEPTNFEMEFVHNEYLQILADYGFIGLLLLLSLGALHFLNGNRFVMGYAKFQPAQGFTLPRSNHLALVVGAMGALATIAFLAFFDFVLHIPAIAILATIFAGILACPDPMSNALKAEKTEPYIPGGGLLFTGRAVAFGCAVAMTFFSFIFGRSERHLEIAKTYFEAGKVDSEQLRHLDVARRIDPANPFAKSLSGHSHVRAIRADMSAAERLAYLEKAEQYFHEAAKLYPQDIHTATAHSVVLDALDRHEEASLVIRSARDWAPLYGNLMVAQAEHFLRAGEIHKAERSFLAAKETPVFRDDTAIENGLEAIAKWKGLLEEETTPPNQLASTEEAPSTGSPPASLMKKGLIREVEIASDIDNALDASIKLMEEKLGGELVEPVE